MTEQPHDAFVGSAPNDTGVNRPGAHPVTDPTAPLPQSPSTTWLPMTQPSQAGYGVTGGITYPAGPPAQGYPAVAGSGPDPAGPPHEPSPGPPPMAPSSGPGATALDRPVITGVNVTAVGFGVLVILAGALGLLQLVTGGAIDWGRLGPGLMTGIGVVLVVMGTVGVARRRSTRRRNC